MSDRRRMLLVLGGTAVLSAATMANAALGPTVALLPLAFAAYLALTLWAVLAPAAPASGAGGVVRLGPLALAAALLAALGDRHLMVSSRGLAPDDLAVAVTSLVLLLIAARAPRLAGRPLVLAAALAAYALIGVAFIAGVPYHSDAVANVHRAAELLVSGADPYRSLDTLESLDRFGIDRQLGTHLQDGSQLRSFNYPVLAVLLPAPFVALGLADLRPLYLALLVIAALAATAAVSPAWRPLLLAAVIGNVTIARQHVLAGIDPAWAILLAGSLLVLDRARRERGTAALVLSAILLGLACASRQPAWFAAPLAAASVLRVHGPARAAAYAAAAAVAFVLPALPFLAAAPASYVSGVLAPIVVALEPHGVGVAALGLAGVLPLLGRGVYAALALGALAIALAVAARRGPAAPGIVVPALAPVYLAWRALQSYFTFVGPLALLCVAREADQTAAASRGEPVRSRQPMEVSDARR